jgi:hypothetical protein
MISDKEAYEVFCTLDYILNRKCAPALFYTREVFAELLSINLRAYINIPISFIDSTGEELTTATVTQLTWDGIQLSLAVM